MLDGDKGREREITMLKSAVHVIRTTATSFDSSFLATPVLCKPIYQPNCEAVHTTDLGEKRRNDLVHYTFALPVATVQQSIQRVLQCLLPKRRELATKSYK